MAVTTDISSSVLILFLTSFIYYRGEGDESLRGLTWSRRHLLLTGLCVTCHHTHTRARARAQADTHNPHCFYHSHGRRYTHMWGWQKSDTSPVEPQIRPRRQATSGFTHTDTHIQKRTCDCTQKHTHTGQPAETDSSHIWLSWPHTFILARRSDRHRVKHR